MYTYRGSKAKDRICEAFVKVNKQLGKEGISTCVMPEGKPAELLGQAFWDYMTASIYDCEWEGFKAEEIRGIAAFMEDFATGFDTWPPISTPPQSYQGVTRTCGCVQTSSHS